jgi:hypothetical protein
MNWIRTGLLTIIISFGSVYSAFSQVPCVGADLSNAQAAQKDAKGTLLSIGNYLRANDASTQALVFRWFGRNDSSTLQAVAGVYSRTETWIDTVSPYCLYQNDGSLVSKVYAPDGSIVLQDDAGNIYAYVDPGNLTVINLGLKFFSAPSIGMNSQLGTVIHEVTHYFLTGNTQDVRYGKDACLDLARRDPDSAIRNADNFEYFVEEWLGTR